MNLRKSSPKIEGAYKASKWQKFHVLCDELELKALFDLIGPCLIYPIGRVFKEDVEPICQSEILKNYKQVLNLLKEGTVDTSFLHLPFVITKSKDALYQYEVKEKQILVQIAKPVVQWQIHKFRYSEVDGKIRSMVFGKDSIFWGFEFSFPSLFQTPQRGEILKVDKDFENFSLSGLLRKWIRDQTRPTTFDINGKIVKESIRLGKNCLSWIQSHPELKYSNIAIR